MYVPPDLHPDDLAQRECLRDLLVDTRHARAMTQANLADRLGKGKSTVANMELDLHWRISTVQRWARGLGLRLLLTPAILSNDVYLLPPADPDAAMAFDRQAAIESLAEARRAARMTQQQLADRLGVTEAAVYSIEKERDVLLLTAQRYCRGLGSFLFIDLEEVPPPWPPA